MRKRTPEEPGGSHVFRGGSFVNDAPGCRAASHIVSVPSRRRRFGFRVSVGR